MKPVYAQIGDRVLNEKEQKQLAGLRKQMLDRMVNDALMAQEIKKYGIAIPDEAIDDEIKKIKDERGFNDEDLDAMLKQDGLTLSGFREKLKGIIEKQELLGFMVHSKVLVTDSEIRG